MTKRTVNRYPRSLLHFDHVLRLEPEKKFRVARNRIYVMMDILSLGQQPLSIILCVVLCKDGATNPLHPRSKTFETSLPEAASSVAILMNHK